MNTTESNKLIAEFMGATFFKDGSYDEYPKEMKGEVWGDQIDNFLKYHTSWDWLMPVVEKIEGLPPVPDKDKYEVNIDGCYCEIGAFFIQVTGETKLQATYAAVVGFITWYNSLTPNS